MIQPRSAFNLRNTVSGITGWVQRSGIIARPTMEHPQYRLQTHGYAEPNAHYAASGTTNPGGSGPVSTFSPFLESHMRAVRPPAFR